MMRMLLSLLIAAPSAAFTAQPVVQGHVAPVARSAVARMFESSPKGPDGDDVKIVGVTRSREALTTRSGSIAVTDGTGSFYASRKVFQQLFDFGNFASISACSESAVETKKVLLSRTARYSGLLGALSFKDAADFSGADTWLALSPDEATVGAQVDAAVAAGVSRIFLLLSDALDAPEALEAKLAASGAEYTVMRTGPLVDAEGGGGLKLGDVDMAVCEDVPKEDVFRFVTEALTLPEANGRAFSLCPSDATASYLKQMRLCGYERREEIQLLLSGSLKEPVEEGADLSAEEKEEQAELVLRSEAELAAEREEELRMLLARARQRGKETQEKMAFEEAERLAKRKEQEKYYSSPKDEGSEDIKADASSDDDDKPAVPDAPPAPPKDE